MRPAPLLALLLVALTCACSSPDNTSTPPRTTSPTAPPGPASDVDAGVDADQEVPPVETACPPPDDAEMCVYVVTSSFGSDSDAAAELEGANQERLANLPPDYDQQLQAERNELLRQLAVANGDSSSVNYSTDPSGDLPADQGALLIRTDLTRPAQWQDLLTRIDTPAADGAVPGLLVVDHPRWAGASPTDLAAAAPAGELLVLADYVALSSPELPVLVLTTDDGQLQQLRVAASALASVENNLSLANMHWYEFTDAADPDGVFRGFDRPAAR